MKKLFFTGGHHNSTLTLVEWINSNSRDIEIIWVGRKFLPRSTSLFTPEYLEVKDKVKKFYHIDAGKFYRIRSIRYLPQLIIGLIKIPIGFLVSFKILVVEKPDLVISWGGFIGVPVVICAWILGIKSITHEQTVTLGLANKIISFFVEKIYTAWPVENYPSHIQKKASYIGLPLRKSNSSEVFRFKNSNPILYVSGGKHGSEVINSFVLSNLSDLTQKVNLIWSCGQKAGITSYDIIKKTVEQSDCKDKIILRDYFGGDEILKVYKSVNIAFSRAGAHTVYELMAYKIPSIFCPIPWSSQNEQLKNAKIAQKIGTASIIEESELNYELFLKTLIDLLENQRHKTDSDKSNILILNAEETLGKEILNWLDR